MNICVFCSSNDLDEKYEKPARELAKLLGKGGHTLLWGGSRRGLMKVMADGVREEGGRLIGVTLELFKDHAYTDADELTIAKTLAERKSLLLERSDAIIILPGGLGTLDELTEVIEHKRHGAHTCEIIILNTDGFYDGLKMQLKRMSDEGFLPVAELGRKEQADIARWVTFIDKPQDAMEVAA